MQKHSFRAVGVAKITLAPFRVSTRFRGPKRSKSSSKSDQNSIQNEAKRMSKKRRKLEP